ncbi:MAG: nicotinate phosphoribosyltransferase [Gammaproteobacteria bacterium]|nr:nicotinate phosphoribosyltransferase [Gammaproteobacteria bacterium]
MNNKVLLTDLYELTMLQAYAEHKLSATAVFEFFVRKLPQQRHFLLAAGLEQVVTYLEELSFTAADLEWLAGEGHLGQDFVDSLADFRFTGDVDAMREGTAFFADEPILRITAPIAEAQLVESRVVNILHLQSLIASKAARCVLAAPDRMLVDFGMRRAHGAEAALAAARASYLAGFSGTATVRAGQLYGIPLYGTMAHSFVQAHDSEVAAFRAFAESHPQNCVLLIDTYDTLQGAGKVVSIAQELARRGIQIKAVRLDSGDLAALSRDVRQLFDENGLSDIGIFASGSIDEYRLAELARQQAPIDGYGIGTHLDVSADAPYLDCVYKLQEYDGIARRKRSTGKATWPGRKQVFREYAPDGIMERDELALVDCVCPGEPLLQPVMRNGRRVVEIPGIEQVRAHAAAELKLLPASLKGLEEVQPYSVSVHDALQHLAAEVDRRTAQHA